MPFWTGDNLASALNNIGRDDVADSCLGTYINLDVTRDQDEAAASGDDEDAGAFFGGKLNKLGEYR